MSAPTSYCSFQLRNMDYTTILAFVILIFSIKQLKKSNKPKKLPPGPKTIPILGNLHQLTNPIHRSFQTQAKEHGPLMFMQLGSVPTLIISSADVLSDIFKSHDLVFSNRPVLYSANKLSYNCSDIVLTPYGEKWRELRKIATVELLSAKKVQSFQQVRKQEVDMMIDSVANNCSGKFVDLSELTLELANNVVCRVAFGRKFEKGGSKMVELLREAQDLLGGFCVADYLPWMGWMCKINGYESRLDKNFKELDKFYDAIIEEHKDLNRRKSDNDDLVDILLKAQNDPTREFPITDDCIKGVLMDMFIAGTDTTSATLVWTLTELIRNPSIMERTKQEIRASITSQGKNRVEESDLPQLNYLKSVIKESLRVHPPAPLSVPRETTKDTTIRGYEIPARTRVIINTASISMDPEAWENPGEFRPERFLESKIEYGGQHYEYVPFGVGRRVCPGLNFSTVLVELALANLLLVYDWDLPNGMVKEDLDMEEASGITMHKKIHLCLVASPI